MLLMNTGPMRPSLGLEQYMSIACSISHDGFG
jgi:hypothetical protein